MDICTYKFCSQAGWHGRALNLYGVFSVDTGPLRRHVVSSFVWVALWESFGCYFDLKTLQFGLRNFALADFYIVTKI